LKGVARFLSANNIGILTCLQELQIAPLRRKAAPAESANGGSKRLLTSQFMQSRWNVAPDGDRW
jgi:hypothetical protein